ncbi:MAG: hypothetical protein V3U31_04275 [Dehalococcoidia bacterium]
MKDKKRLAAALAAIACYLAEEAQPSPQPSPWLLMGRREQMLRRDPRRWRRRGRREVYDSAAW